MNSSTPISKWLSSATSQLADRDIPSARLDALILLGDQLGRDKAWILAHEDEILTSDVVHTLNKKLAQRATHIPLAYIRGHSEFYGRTFAVNTHVLIPRPESEAIINLLKSIDTGHEPSTIFDIGTGSGCLAITAALEFPAVKVVAVDIDPCCLTTAQQNAQHYGVVIKTMKGNLLAPIMTDIAAAKLGILLCNLPYVPENYPVNGAAAHEPSLALFSGADGLDHYRTLFTQLDTLNNIPTYIVTESLSIQHHALASMAREHGYVLEKTQGLAQLFAR